MEGCTLWLPRWTGRRWRLRCPAGWPGRSKPGRECPKGARLQPKPPDRLWKHTAQTPAQFGLRYTLYFSIPLHINHLNSTSQKYFFNSSVHKTASHRLFPSGYTDPPFSDGLNVIINLNFKSQASICLLARWIYLHKSKNSLPPIYWPWFKRLYITLSYRGRHCSGR